jgi:hypothetical protein
MSSIITQEVGVHLALPSTFSTVQYMTNPDATGGAAVSR